MRKETPMVFPDPLAGRNWGPDFDPFPTGTTHLSPCCRTPLRVESGRIFPAAYETNRPAVTCPGCGLKLTLAKLNPIGD